LREWPGSAAEPSLQPAVRRAAHIFPYLGCQRHPLIIDINERDAAPVRSATPTEAAARATALIAADKSVDLGLMQINSGERGWLGLAVEDGFEPCRAIVLSARP